MENLAFHSSLEQFLIYRERSIRKAIDAGHINKDEAKLITEFFTEIGVQNNLSEYRKMNLTSNLCTAFRYLGPSLFDATIADIYAAFEAIRNGKTIPTKTRKEKPYTQNTICGIQSIFKRFLLWTIENEYTKLDRKKISKMRAAKAQTITKTEEDILTEEEVTRLINTPRTIRYRALLGVLYEGGFRIQEIACLKWEDVLFLNWGCRIRTNGKTGKERVVPILTYAETLAKYKSECRDPSPDNLVFLNEHGKPLKYASIVKNLRIYSKEAGIVRPITPHTFRHSRITHCLRRGMSEILCKKTFWGNAATSMIQTYEHLTPDDSEKALAKIAGIDIPDEEERDHSVEPIQCMRCHTINPPLSRFCSRCGMSLTGDSTKDYDTAISYLEDAFKTLSDSERIEVITALSKLGNRK